MVSGDLFEVKEFPYFLTKDTNSIPKITRIKFRSIMDSFMWYPAPSPKKPKKNLAQKGLGLPHKGYHF